MKSENSKIVGGFFWKLAERTSSQGAHFLLSVILARLLLPEEYGLVAMINIFIVIANVFVTGGFTASLIQKKDADELDFSTIFYCTLLVSVLMYVVIYLCAPSIASFYNMPELCLLTRVYALSLVITSYQTIQQAYISRHMLFKKTFVSAFIGTIISGVIGVIMAYMGYGVWALVVQHLSNIIANMFALFYIIPWRPKLMFAWSRAKSLMLFGTSILTSTLINTVYKEIQQLLIGKMYTPADLGYFNRGMSLPNLVSSNVDMSIRSVLFPAMSDHSNDPARVKQMLRRGIKTSSYIMFFLFTLMATSSKPIIILLLTEKWLPCVLFMQIFCISKMFLIISGYNVQAIKALGEGKEVVKLEVFKKPVFLVVILAAAKFGVLAIALTLPINALYAMFMNMRPSQKLLDYHISEQLKDVIPATVMALVTAIVTLPFLLLDINPLAIMFMQILCGVVFYVGLSKVFQVESYVYVENLALGILKRKNK